jgi:hypothetical protein
MLIPMQQTRTRNAEARSRQLSNEQLSLTRLLRVEQRFFRLKRIALSCTRLMAILIGILSFRWSNLMPVHVPTVALAITVGCLALILGHGQPPAGWPTLALDSLTIFLLLYGTGAAASPLLGLLLLPILIGGLLGGSNGVLAGTGSSVAMFLIVKLMDRDSLNAIAFDLVLLLLACGLVISWLWRGADILLATLRDDIHTQHEAARDLEDRRASADVLEADRLIASCTTLDQLGRLTSERTAAVAGASARVELASALCTDRSCDPHVLCVAIPSEDVAGTITVHAAPGDLSQAQRQAIEHLACMVGLRWAALRRGAWQERQQAAVAALWEISGLLRTSSTGYESVSVGLTRLAQALDLGWIALLAPNEFNALAPYMVARGRGARGAPTISGAQLRVAAEALRGERPLIRREGADSLACLPICLAGQAPMVMSAYGNIDDASTQALLMLFGNLIAERLAADNSMRAAEPGLERAFAA